MSQAYVRYSDDVESVASDEAETVDHILASMRRIDEQTRAKEGGHAVRTSHAKSHGVAVGELTVLDGLPEPLRQGLFARAATYPVIVRLSNVPGEIVPDAVNTQRGFAFKVLGVAGEMLPAHAGETTQDFVLENGDRFTVSDIKTFLAFQLGLEPAPRIPGPVKVAVSSAARLANEALHAVNVESPNLDFLGHPRIHPLAEAYFTQAPIRYGDYIAKLAVVPVAPGQLALSDAKLDEKNDPNALRTATVGYLRDNDAAFDVRVQLCTDLETMPVEDAHREWREDESPYVTVARLRIPRQDAYSPARQAYVDDDLSFCPSHSLAAHRPLGSIMRARLRAYPAMSRLRREANGRPLTEPASIETVPA